MAVWSDLPFQERTPVCLILCVIFKCLGLFCIGTSHIHIYIYTHVSVVFFLGTGDMTKARLGIVRVVAHPAARMFA